MLFKQKCKKKLLRKPTYVIVRGGRKFCGWETGEEPDDPVTSAATDLRDLGRPAFPRALTHAGCCFPGHSERDSSAGCFQKCWAVRFPLGCSKWKHAVFSPAPELTFCSSEAMKEACSERGVVVAGRAVGHWPWRCDHSDQLSVCPCCSTFPHLQDIQSWRVNSEFLY